MGFTVRRSLPSLTGLLALVLLVGFAFVWTVGAPPWFPVAFAIVAIGLQYLINPWIIQWLVPATVIDHDGNRYLTDHPVGALVARRCRDAGIPLVKLGIVDDGNPNAFTFGRTPSDARMWVTRGLLERLNENELDAVVTHEVGHVKHWDFAVMTVAAVVPMLLYLVYLVTRTSDRQGKAIAIGAYIAYLVSYFTVLALSRAREYAADHWSCECTGNGDALASALVKIAYGMGQVIAEQKEQAAALASDGGRRRRQKSGLDRGALRTQSMRVMGIFDQRGAEAMATALADGINPDRAVAAMRWDVVNPWGKTLEKLATHPLVARRIAALEESGLPGAPKTWGVMRSLTAVPESVRAAARAGFARDLTIAVAPWVVLALVVFTPFIGSASSAGVVVIGAGALFLLKQNVRYPKPFVPVEEVTSLLMRLDAGPVSGIAVTVRGTIIGRGTPGYVLSPDLVVQDESGFVPLLYRQPVPFLATLFGLFRARAFLGQQVEARGWYRRQPGPTIELRDLKAADGRRAKAWEWLGRWIGSAVVVAAGVVVLLAGIGH